MTEESNQPFQAAPEEVPVSSPSQPTEEGGENLCIFCKNCNARNRKIGYYCTLIFGCVCYIFAITSFFDADAKPELYTIVGTLIAIFCPLWVQSCGKVCEDLKNPLRWTTAIVMFVCLGALITCVILWPQRFVVFLLTLGTVLSSLWYVLSFHPTIQAKIKTWIGNCCSKMPNPTSGKDDSKTSSETNATDSNANAA